jgi:hypothetical protein
MDEKLHELINSIRSGLDKVADCCGCNTYTVDVAIDELVLYLETKEIRDPKRKCVDKTHHFKGCDCW